MPLRRGRPVARSTFFETRQESDCWLAPTPLSRYCLLWCQGFVWVDRQGVPSRAQRKGLSRAQELRRDDETRWRPARCSLSSRRRPPAGHPDEPLLVEVNMLKTQEERAESAAFNPDQSGVAGSSRDPEPIATRWLAGANRSVRRIAAAGSRAISSRLAAICAKEGSIPKR